MVEIQREKLLPKIEAAFVTGVSYVSNRYIDRFNINLAIEKALYRLVQRFKRILKKKKDSPKLQTIFFDGNYCFKSSDWITQDSMMPQIKHIVKGDQRLFTIACASIVGKVYRDNLIKKIAKKYPDYHLETNKGYGTKKHRLAIQELGITKHHRMSFLSNIVVI